MLFGRHEIKIDVYINYGNDEIRRSKWVAEPGIGALEALAEVANIEYTPDESATCHHGAMVLAIIGFKVDINHFWIYYIYDDDHAGWMLPMRTPDLLKITKGLQCGMALPHRNGRNDIQKYGPLWTSSCISKIKRCNRQF